MTHEERARDIVMGLRLEPRRALIRALSAAFAAVEATAREEIDHAWVDEIARHGGWGSDVLFLRCLKHREYAQLNADVCGGGECGACAYAQGYESAKADSPSPEQG